MTKKRRKRAKSRKKKKKSSKRHVPLSVLAKRYQKLGRLIKARGGKV